MGLVVCVRQASTRTVRPARKDADLLGRQACAEVSTGGPAACAASAQVHERLKPGQADRISSQLTASSMNWGRRKAGIALDAVRGRDGRLFAELRA